MYFIILFIYFNNNNNYILLFIYFDHFFLFPPPLLFFLLLRYSASFCNFVIIFNFSYYFFSISSNHLTSKSDFLASILLSIPSFAKFFSSLLINKIDEIYSSLAIRFLSINSRYL